MDVFDIRLTNLKALVEQLQAEGNPRLTRQQVAFALDMSPSYLSQLLGGKKMGEDVARKLEKLRSMNHGAMDREPAPPALEVHAPLTPSSPVPSHSVGLDPRILGASFKLLRAAFALRGLEFDPERDPDLLAQTYAFLADQEDIASPDNLIDFGRYLSERRTFDGLGKSGGSDEQEDGGAGGSDRDTGKRSGGSAKTKASPGGSSAA